MMQIKHYPQSPAIEQLLAGTGSDNARLTHGYLVEYIRGATATAMNDAIGQTGASGHPENAICEEAVWAGLIEGFMEALWYDIAASVTSEPTDGIDQVESALARVRAALLAAYGDLERDLTEYARTLGEQDRGDHEDRRHSP